MRHFVDPLFAEILNIGNPFLCSGDGGMMPDMGGGGAAVDQADGGGDGAEIPTDTGDGADAGTDILGDPGEAGTGEGTGLGDEGDKPEGGERPEAPAGADKEPLPAALSKAIRELKSAHQDSPETLRAIKALNDSYYASRAFKSIFPNGPDEARTTQAALEAVGGPEGIAAMRNEIRSISDFDEMARNGDPKVIEGLAQEFPDGFKRLVPAAIQRLSNSDPAAYRETMRGPLLQMLEGDGLIDVIGAAVEELKAGNSDRAQRELSRIAQWYNGLKQQETEFKGRYQDPRLKELETRQQQLRTQQSEVIRGNVARDLQSYLKQTLTPAINTVLQGTTLQSGGRLRFEQNVEQEIHKILGANDHYRQSLKDLISQGKVEQAVSFAKPFVDAARRKAVPAVYSDLYGNAPAARPQVRTSRPAAGANGDQQRQAVGDKPVPVNRKPGQEEVDWSKDPKGTLWITGKAFLKSGKFVDFSRAGARV